MRPPKADPAALAARRLPIPGGTPFLVVDVPNLAGAERLDPDRNRVSTWFCTHWPTHAALEAAGFPSTFGAWLPDGLGCEAALVFLPKGRERIRMTLAMVASALPEGAPLRIVGTRRGGIESASREVDVVATRLGVESGKHARLIMARTRARLPASLETYASVWELTTESGRLRIASFPGVFSHGRLDDGSRLLLDTVASLPGPLLDVGSGAGVLGAWYARGGAAPLTLVDADALAVEASRRTLGFNSLQGTAEPADVLPAVGAFASIVANPPFHQGVETDHRVTTTLISGARARLFKGGALTLVCNRFLPVPALLDRAFGSHRVLADDGRYRVYRSCRE